MRARHNLPPFLLLVAASACWGVGTVLSKLALDRGLAPVVLLTIELAASCSLLVVIIIASTRALPHLPRSSQYSKLVGLGALNPAMAYALGLLGLTSITASLAVMIWAVEPVLVAVLAVALLRDRPPVLVAILSTVAIFGTALVLTGSGAHGNWLGVVLTLAAVTACALYTVLTRKLILDDASLVVVLGQQLLALVLVLVWLVVAAAVTAGGALGGRPEPAAVLLAALSGVVYYGLAFASYVAGLRQVSAVTAAAVLPLIPVWGLVAGFLAGDRLAPIQWFGAAVVGLAVLVIGVHGSAAASAETTAPAHS